MEQTFNKDQILASAIRFLIDGSSTEAAATLFSCSIERISFETLERSYGDEIEVTILLRCPRHAYDRFNTSEHYNDEAEEWVSEHPSVKEQVSHAFEALFSGYDVIMNYAAELMEVNPHWRQELLEYIKGYKTNNQGTFIKEEKALVYNSFRYASHGEVEIAKCLTNNKAFFLPNCKAQLLNTNGASIHVYPDFLVCHNKKWAILEVDSHHHYNANSVASDRTRDQAFDLYGVRTWRVDYQECLERPSDVVNRFLKFLSN